VEPRDYVGEAQLEALARDRSRLAASGELDRALSYPSSNYWIVEQIGVWLALGRIPGFTHDTFDSREVIQGVEYHHWSNDAPLPVLAHYYSSNTRAFFGWWNARPQPGAGARS
jgi:hypothetical protein